MTDQIAAARFQICAWAPVGFFPGVGKLGGLETKVPSGVQGWSPSGVWEKSPEKLTKNCENNA